MVELIPCRALRANPAVLNRCILSGGNDPIAQKPMKGRRTNMGRKNLQYLSIAVVAAGAFLAVWLGRGTAQQASGEPKVNATDIGGIVTSAKGPEAGVWVIAETTELPTKFVKIVVTDDQGRYVVPDLPKANYNVFVRGYGLVDSPKSKATPGMTMNLKAVPAPDKKAAIEYYPALYWFSLLQIPPKSDFPGTGPSGN